MKNKLRWLFVLAINTYLRRCFARASKHSAPAGRRIFFMRGAFTRDVEASKEPHDVLINANILRRLFMLCVNDLHQLEQIVCLYYADELRRILAPVIEEFFKLAAKADARELCFGGIDYFEVVVFELEARKRKFETVAIFHENYTIPLVVRQTENLLSSYPEVPAFTRVHAIGPPALAILSKLFADVKPHSSQRFVVSSECKDFEFDVLLIPFADIAYFAPIAFSICYARLVDLSQRIATKIVVKHKNSTELRAFKKVFGHAKGLHYVTNPSASHLCAVSRVVICFNSLVYFEALAKGHVIAVPNIGDAKIGESYTQHEYGEDERNAGIFLFNNPEELARIVEDSKGLKPSDRLQWLERRKRILEKVFFS